MAVVITPNKAPKQGRQTSPPNKAANQPVFEAIAIAATPVPIDLVGK
ncbi:MAG: hypothetical protein ACJAYX_003510 [Planctomycetota bacterium]